jgi:hypothetical protein
LNVCVMTIPVKMKKIFSTVPKNLLKVNLYFELSIKSTANVIAINIKLYFTGTVKYVPAIIPITSAIVILRKGIF